MPHFLRNCNPKEFQPRCLIVYMIFESMEIYSYIGRLNLENFSFYHQGVGTQPQTFHDYYHTKKVCLQYENVELHSNVITNISTKKCKYILPFLIFDDPNSANDSSKYLLIKNVFHDFFHFQSE